MTSNFVFRRQKNEWQFGCNFRFFSLLSKKTWLLRNNACTQGTICFFTVKCKILKTVLKQPFVFHSKIRNLVMYPNCHLLFDYKIRNILSCFETVTFFWQQIKKSNVTSKLLLVFWRRNTKFKVIPKRPFVFLLKATKMEL